MTAMETALPTDIYLVPTKRIVETKVEISESRDEYDPETIHPCN